MKNVWQGSKQHDFCGGKITTCKPRNRDAGCWSQSAARTGADVWSRLRWTTAAAQYWQRKSHLDVFAESVIWILIHVDFSLPPRTSVVYRAHEIQWHLLYGRKWEQTAVFVGKCPQMRGTVTLQLRRVQWSSPCNDFSPVMDFRRSGNQLNCDCFWQICSRSSQKQIFFPRLFVQHFTNKTCPWIRSEEWQQGGEEETEEADVIGGDTKVRSRYHRRQMNGNKLSGTILKWDQ